MTYLLTAFGMVIGMAVAHAIGLRIDYITFMFGALTALFLHWLSSWRDRTAKGGLTEGK